MHSASNERAATVLGRYVIFDVIASGGMATVHLGRLIGAAGFARTVAIKRLHPQFAKDPEFVNMFMDEARVTARIRHPNVVTTLDVVAQDGELFVIMEYIHGEPLSRLLGASARAKKRVPPRVVATIMAGALHGLHAAHEATNELGQKLFVVHRDVSPHNILVSTDGVARVLDFGIAKAAGRSSTTREGEIKGKFAYMPPEQLHGEPLDRRADVYAAGVVLWEALTCSRLFHGAANVLDLHRLLAADAEPPSTHVPDLPRGFDEVTMRALAPEANHRYASAREMALALERCVTPAPPSEVSAWVEELVGESLSERARQIISIEADASAPSSKILCKNNTLAYELLKIIPAGQDPQESAGSGDTTLILRSKQRPLDNTDDTTIALRRPVLIAAAASNANATSTRSFRATHDDRKARPTKPSGDAFRGSATASKLPSEPGAASAAPRSGVTRLRRLTVLGASIGAVVILWILGIVVSAAFLGLRRPPNGVPLLPEATSASGSAASTGASPRPPPPPAVSQKAPQAMTSAAPGATAVTVPSSSGLSPKRPSTAAATPAPPPSARGPTSRPHATTLDPCKPPFVIDAQGHKRYKRECL
jgi:serine/threonine-protein kinase